MPNEQTRYAIALTCMVRAIIEKGYPFENAREGAATGANIDPITLGGMFALAEQKAEGAARVAIRKARVGA